MSDNAKPSEAPNHQDIINAIAAVAQQEQTLRDAVTDRDAAVQSLVAERQNLLARLDQIESDLQEPQQALLQAQHNVEVNSAALSNRMEALGRLFIANPLPEGFRDLFEPLQLLNTPVPPPQVSTPAVSRSNVAGSVIKKRRVGDGDSNVGQAGDEEDASDYEQQDTSNRSSTKRKRASRISRAAAEARELALEHNRPGLLDWVFKSNAPAYLKGSESVIWVRHPFTLNDDNVNKHVNKYYSIRCPICNGNSSVGKNGEFMCGLDGMWLHVSRQHKDSDWAKKKAMNVFDDIPKTELSADEVLAIRQKKTYVSSKPAESGSRPVDEHGRRIKKEPVKKRAAKTSTDTAAAAEEAQVDTTSAVDNLIATMGSPEAAATPQAGGQSPFREATPIVMDDPEVEREHQEFFRRHAASQNEQVGRRRPTPEDDTTALPLLGSFPPVNRRAAGPQLPSPSPAPGRAHHVPTTIATMRRSSRAGRRPAVKDYSDEESDDGVDTVPAYSSQ